jgi:hypothetical protein
VFDLRYHVASLAAVFLALLIGIVVGVGISDRGFLRGTERSLFEKEIRDLRRQVDSLRRQQAAQADEERAADAMIREAYPALVGGRLRGTRVAVVFVGPVDGKVDGEVDQALESSGAPPVLRLRAIKVPVDVESIDRALDGRPALASYAGEDKLTSLGRELGEELVTGGQTPLWDTLARELVEERTGGGRREADAVVVAQSAEPQRQPTTRFLDGLYAGLTAGGVPVVGVERSQSGWSAVPTFHRAGVSTVDAVDTLTGRAALVLLLAGGQPGDYGFKKSAGDGPLPPVDTVPEPPSRG